MKTDAYRSIARPASAQIKVSGSRFLAEALPAADEGEVEHHLERIRKREYGATHYCTAFRIGIDAEIFRFNDNGEPSGTAGRPILRQIEARELTNTLVVVTRYFGGTRLGTGGLIRAYGVAASEALDSAGVVVEVISEHLYVSFDYDDTSPAMHVIDQFSAEVLESTYSDVTELTVAVPRSRTEAFEAAFVDALGGRGAVRRT